MKTSHQMRSVSFAAALLLASASAMAGQVTASLDSNRVAAGDTAQLTVTVQGSDNAEPNVPAVPGLQITPAGTSSSFESVNGQVTSSVSYLYQVTPVRTGTFTIPAIDVPGVGRSQELTLQVAKGAGNAAASSGSNLPPPDAPQGTTDDAANATDSPAFLRVVVPMQRLYVGELVPVQIKAYFRAGMSASLGGLPMLSSDAFTLNKLDDKPRQVEETVNGKEYTVLNWSTALTAVKAGDYDVHLELPVTVAVKAKHRRPIGMDDFFKDSGFDDSMFDDFFGGVTQKPLTLQADLAGLKVESLPTAGRPAGFSGAVGTFEVKAEAAPDRVTAGDPVTLKLIVTGHGNFDLVSSPALETSAGWKTYPAKSQFDPDDSAGYAGTKTFEQAVVPLAPGRDQIPPIAFSYFDPNSQGYVTRSTSPIAIEVAAGVGGGSTGQTAAPANSPPIRQTGEPAEPGLAPNKIEDTAAVASLRPVFFSPWFIAAQAVPLVLLFGGVFARRRRIRMANDPDRLRARAARTAVRDQLATMDQALAANSPPAFFAAARGAVQQQLARRWHVSADTVTPDEIDRRMNGDGTELRKLFAVADDVIYSGRPVPPAELREWKAAVVQQVNVLEKT
jgi:hypothetical protein